MINPNRYKALPAGLRPSPTRLVTSVLLRWQTPVAGQMTVTDAVPC